MSRLRELRAAIGGPRAFVAKWSRAARTAAGMLDPRLRQARLQAMAERGWIEQMPTAWQLTLGSAHMLLGYILPSNVQFYEHYDQPHWWQQLIRVLDEPSAVMDPVGFGLSAEMLVSHLVQVVHSSAGYDVALLDLIPGGLEQLEAELDLLVAGRHPRQSALDALVERPGYHARLREAVRAYRADPSASWRVDTFMAPEGCDALYEWGIDTFGSPARLVRYCCRLPRSPWQGLRLPLPAPG